MGFGNKKFEAVLGRQFLIAPCLGLSGGFYGVKIVRRS